MNNKIYMRFIVLFIVIFGELKTILTHDNINDVTNINNIKQKQDGNDFIELVGYERLLFLPAPPNASDQCILHYSANQSDYASYYGFNVVKYSGWFLCYEFHHLVYEFCSPEDKGLIWYKENSNSEVITISDRDCDSYTINMRYPQRVCMCDYYEWFNDTSLNTYWAISLEEQVSDIDNNKIITGVRLREYNRLIYMEIKESKIGSEEEGIWKATNLNNNNVVIINNIDKRIENNVVSVVNDPYVVTGVKFITYPDDTNQISIRVQGTQFNKYNGKLKKDTATWDKSQTHFYNLLRWFELRQDKRDNKYHVLPYLSKAEVQSYDNTPLSGIGLSPNCTIQSRCVIPKIIESNINKSSINDNIIINL